MDTQSDTKYIITLRGTEFILSKSLIEFDSPNYFTARFLELGDYREAQTRRIELYRDPGLFRIIISYLCGYTVFPLNDEYNCPYISSGSTLLNLRADAVFYQLNGLVQACNAQIELNNVKNPATPRYLIIGGMNAVHDSVGWDDDLDSFPNKSSWAAHITEEKLTEEPLNTLKTPGSVCGIEGLRLIAYIQRFAADSIDDYDPRRYRVIEYTLLGLMTRTRPKLPMVVVSDSLDGMAGRLTNENVGIAVPAGVSGGSSCHLNITAQCRHQGWVNPELDPESEVEVDLCLKKAGASDLAACNPSLGSLYSMDVDTDAKYIVSLQGTEFVLTKSLIEFDSPNYFTACFLGDFQEARTRRIELHRDPDLFRIIIFYLCGYTVLPLNDKCAPPHMSPSTALLNLRADAAFYQLDGLIKACDTQIEMDKPKPPSSAWYLILFGEDATLVDNLTPAENMRTYYPKKSDWGLYLTEGRLTEDPLDNMKTPQSVSGMEGLREIAYMERFGANSIKDYDPRRYRLKGWKLRISYPPEHYGDIVQFELFVAFEDLEIPRL
ncbi:BTB domain containing protein [Ceratobasidium theobromae]|uniref:BTB domain containing protein n=1 Tax=Ceratobasidium theobromae TaxID=1582974 RepID=A0A5N5QFZ0_9AGAM|nr:BTB domain containing protein [Ceratobasidium theobromae]